MIENGRRIRHLTGWDLIRKPLRDAIADRARRPRSAIDVRAADLNQEQVQYPSLHFDPVVATDQLIGGKRAVVFEPQSAAGMQRPGLKTVKPSLPRLDYYSRHASRVIGGADAANRHRIV